MQRDKSISGKKTTQNARGINSKYHAEQSALKAEAEGHKNTAKNNAILSKKIRRW